jgi:hypothetical protein
MSDCTRCKGKGTVTYPGFTALDGQLIPEKTNPCLSCGGKGVFPSVNEEDIFKAIIATRGKNKGAIRASMVAPWGSKKTVESVRAYYVWRMARFHGGKDMTIPFSASVLMGGDPYREYLDKLADSIAKRQFGTDMAAAARWAKAFGII